MRLVSLQPSVTLTLAALGKLDVLCAHTRYCIDALPELAELGLPVIQDSWSAATEEILATHPSLVVASVPYRMESLAAILKAGVPVLALSPRTLDDVLSDIRLLGRLTQASDAAERIVQDFHNVFEAYRWRWTGSPSPRVYCEEWGKPLIRSQGWVAELIKAAGGEFVGIPGAHTTPDEVAAEGPDVLIFAWCGAGDRVPLEKVIAKRNWQTLKAVQERRVFCVPDELLNTPAHTLLAGLACLGFAIHPQQFPRPQRLIQLRG